MTELEMKNVFGGSGESGPTVQSGCTLKYKHGDTVVAQISGTCKTVTETKVLGSGETVVTSWNYCDVSTPYKGEFDSVEREGCN